jgi:DNA repair protein RecO (recombination protein O)
MEETAQAKRQRLYRLQVLVMRRRDMGEADRLLTVLTRDRGKVNLLAKGVRRAASRKAGHLEPFTYTDLLVARGANLDLITQAETIVSHRHVREDLWLSSLAYYVVELADAFTQDEDPNALLFELLLETLDRLDANEAVNLALRYYELHILDLAGYQPQLFHCIQCDQPLQQEVNFFSFERGGCLCPKHGSNLPGTIALPLEVLKVMRYLQSRPWEQVAVLQLRPDVLGQVESLMARYIVYHLERTLRAPAFLERLRRMTGARAEGQLGEDA